MVTNDVFRDIMFILFIIMLIFVNIEAVAICRGSGRDRSCFIGVATAAVVLWNLVFGSLVVVVCLGFVASCFVIVY